MAYLSIFFKIKYFSGKNYFSRVIKFLSTFNLNVFMLSAAYYLFFMDNIIRFFKGEKLSK